MPTRIVRIGQAVFPLWDGAGAAVLGGRWNPAGMPVIYAASSLALAMLEIMVRGGDYRHPPRQYVEALVPDDLLIETAEPPPGWQDQPSPSARAYGGAWLAEQRSAVMRVPSVVVPVESNFLVNPAHPDFGRILVSAPAPLAWDARLPESQAPAPTRPRTRRSRRRP